MKMASRLVMCIFTIFLAAVYFQYQLDNPWHLSTELKSKFKLESNVQIDLILIEWNYSATLNDLETNLASTKTELRNSIAYLTSKLNGKNKK
jgi:hypothetical protein